MVMLPPRPSWPADEMVTEFVLVGSKFGAGVLPGTRSASSRKLRPLSGSASMRLVGMTASTTERLVSTPAEPPTVTVSRTLPIVSCRSKETVRPTSRTTSLREMSLNPLAAATRSTRPGGRFETTKSPSAPVVTILVTPLPCPVIVTVAWRTGAPCGSSTRPSIVPEVVWPVALPATTAVAAQNRMSRHSIRIRSSVCGPADESAASRRNIIRIKMQRH